MFSTMIPAVFLFAVFSIFGNYNKCLGFQGRIVNGTNAREGEFPFMVSMRRLPSGRHSCGATLINQNWAMTAAHCVANLNPKRANIQYGANEINTNATNVVNLTRIVVHDSYKPEDLFNNDIALLKLANPIIFNRKVAAVRLPKPKQVTPDDEDATLIGWGYNAVSLQQVKNNGHFCAGTIINSNWILTAAHCFTHLKDPQAIQIQYGSLDLGFKNATRGKIAEIIIHEGYNPTIAVHDIALFRLRDKLTFNKRVRPVKLMKLSKSENSPFANVTLIGWGLNTTSGHLQKHLQKVGLLLLNQSDCKKRTQAFLHETNICAFGENRGQCSGDSGGPLMQNDTQIGIVSWSLKPCGEYPGVFTDISWYAEWILSKMNDNKM